MKKLFIEFIRVIIAALLGLLGFVVFSTIIVAALKDMENTLVQNILLSLICTTAFVIGLMYIKKIRNDKGDYEIMNDYRTDSYISPKEDLRKVLANEKWTLIFICVISILCYIINIIWFIVLGNTIVFPVSFSMIAMTAFQIFFPMTEPILPLLGYLISIVVDIAAYIGVLLVYRKRLYDKNFTMTD